MKEKLKQLLVALGQIETKGESTLVMADCQRFLKGCVDEVEKMEAELTKLKGEGKTE